MKKPLRRDGMAISKMLYGNEAHLIVASPPDKNNGVRTCPGSNPINTGANYLAKASYVQNTDRNTSYRILQHLEEKHYDNCLDNLKKMFWSEIEEECIHG